MAADPPLALPGEPPLRTAVVSVTATPAGEDHPVATIVAGALALAHHRVVATRAVRPDLEALQRVVQDLLDASVDAIVVCGGVGVSALDVTPDALEPMYVRPIPGFGELFRTLFFQAVGPAAMLVRPVAGVCGRAVVFAVPDQRRGAELAMDRLVLPTLRPLVEQARVEAGVASGRGWQAALEAAGLSLKRDQYEPLPAALKAVLPFVDLLEPSREQAVLEVDTWRYSVWGFPDLRRPSSRVLAVSAGGTTGEVVALHRYPEEVGTCVRGAGGWVVSRDRSVAEVALSLTGEVPPSGGALFAVAGPVVYIERAQRVFRWDGRRQVDLGPVPVALVTLAKEWIA